MSSAFVAKPKFCTEPNLTISVVIKPLLLTVRLGV